MLNNYIKTTILITGIFCKSALAQPVIPYGPQGNNLSANYCSLSGCTISGSINVSGTATAANYKINGLNAIWVSVGNPGQQGVFVGPGSGAALQSSGTSIGFGAVGIGNSTAASFTNGGAEFACGGAFSCQFATTAYAMTAWGEHNIGYDNSNNMTCSGNDCMRDVIGNTGSSGYGAQSQDDGVGNNNTSIGALSMQGNAGSIIFSGSVAIGEHWCLPFTTTNVNLVHLPASACFTTTTTTLQDLLTGLVTAISSLGVYDPNGSGPSPGNGVSFAADAWGNNTTAILRFHFPGGNTTGWAIQPGTPTCTSGTCAEIVTVQAPWAVTHSQAFGIDALQGYSLVGGNGLSAIGDFTLSNLQGSGNNYGQAWGYSTGSGLTSISNSILAGNNVLTGAGSTSANDLILLTNGFTGTYTGSKNTLLNSASVSGSAVGNIAIGWNAQVPSSTANWQISIGDGVYGTNCNQGGGGGSTGCQIGIVQPAPGARLDVLGKDTSTSTLAFRVQNSTPSIVFSVSDGGNIQVGSGAFTANGTTVVTLTALAPSGAGATVAEWLTIKDASGNVRYIPAF